MELKEVGGYVCVFARASLCLAGREQPPGVVSVPKTAILKIQQYNMSENNMSYF